MSENATEALCYAIFQQTCTLAKNLSPTKSLEPEDRYNMTQLRLWIRTHHGAGSPYLHTLDILGDKEAFSGQQGAEHWENLSDLLEELLAALDPTLPHTGQAPAQTSGPPAGDPLARPHTPASDAPASA